MPWVLLAASENGGRRYVCDFHWKALPVKAEGERERARVSFFLLSAGHGSDPEKPLGS